MTRFRIIGRPTTCSREYVRAWLHASGCVLAYHNKVLPSFVNVELTEDLDDGIAGTWSRGFRRISLCASLKPEAMATTILHEVIHAACGHFGGGTDEKCCSTLTARLKPHVQMLAQPLVDDTYRRAAYIAHTKLSYVVEEDYYDRDEDRRVGVKDPHGERRRMSKDPHDA